MVIDSPLVGSTNIHKYRIAHISLHFTEAVELSRLMPSCDSTKSDCDQTDSDFWSIVGESRLAHGLGLFRLTCEEQIFESYPYVDKQSIIDNSKRSNLSPPIYLIPIIPSTLSSPQTDHPVYDILRQKMGSESSNARHGSNQSSFTQFSLALVLDHSHIDSPSSIHKTTIMTPRDLSQCSLSILPDAEQTLRPAVSLLTSGSKKTVDGEIRYIPCDDHNNGSGRGITPVSMCLTSQPTHTQSQSHTPRPVPSSTSGVSVLTEEHVDTLLRSASQLVTPHTHTRTHTHARTPQQDCPPVATNFLQSSMTVSEGVGNVVEALLAPLQPLFSNVFNGVWGGMFQTVLGYSMAPGVSESITKDLLRIIPAHLKVSVPTAVAEVVKDQLPGPVAKAVGDYVTWTVSNKITEYLMDHVTPTVAEVTVRRLLLTVPGKVSFLTTRHLAPMLTKSVTHSIVPALTQTLERSPLRWSWCEACREHKKLCEYCWQTSTTLHNGFYYAGYYSTYYADYYSRFFEGETQTKRKWKKRQDLNLEITRNRYEVVRDVKADE